MSRSTCNCRFAAFALALATLFTAQAAVSAKPIKIGVTTAQSPPGSVSQGVQVRDGIEVTAKIINDCGGLLLPLKADPPDMVVNIMIPPAAYILLNQLYEQGIAPSQRTSLYDLSNADNPDFWQNVGEAAKYMLEFGLYHPKMSQPELGKKVAAAYKAKAGNDANRLVFQAADSLLIVAEAIRVSRSTDPDAIIKTLAGLKYTGTRGEISFSSEKGGFRFRQWVDIPYLIMQIAEVNQKLDDMAIVQDIGQPFDAAKLIKPR